MDVLTCIHIVGGGDVPCTSIVRCIPSFILGDSERIFVVSFYGFLSLICLYLEIIQSSAHIKHFE